MRSADLSAVSPLAAQLGYSVSIEELEARFAELQRLRHHLLLVAVDSAGRVVGWLHAARTASLTYSPSVQIVGVVVDESQRGRGIGGALMSAAEQWAASLGLPAVWLRSRLEREGAHRFYLDRGYRIAKTQHAFVRALDGAGSSRLPPDSV
jgi:GNAT superfamily N-acetyltransferase